MPLIQCIYYLAFQVTINENRLFCCCFFFSFKELQPMTAANLSLLYGVKSSGWPICIKLRLSFPYPIGIFSGQESQGAKELCKSGSYVCISVSYCTILRFKSSVPIPEREFKVWICFYLNIYCKIPAFFKG